MKRIFLLLITLVVMIALSGCEESNDPKISDNDRDKHVLDRFEENESISYGMFDILTVRMTPDSLKTLKANAATKETFIDVVARQTDDYFNEVVEGGIAAFDITTIPTPFAGEAEITLKLLASTQSAGAAPFDVVGEYSKELLKRIEEEAAAGHKDWIIIESIALPGETASDSKPSETLSLNFEEIKLMATVPHNIIMDLNLSDDQVLTSINDVLNANDIPPVAIALLLPAVQKVREAHTANNSPFENALKTWLNGPITQAMDGNLDRDIIRRIQATVYLAALHTIILNEYKASNQDVASLSVLHARYRAALIVAAKELWGD